MFSAFLISIDLFYLLVLATTDAAAPCSRKNWDGHEEQMYARVKDISNEDLVDFDVEKDLVAVRAGSVAYGTIVSSD